jgi:hypothetical protein
VSFLCKNAYGATLVYTGLSLIAVKLMRMRMDARDTVGALETIQFFSTSWHPMIIERFFTSSSIVPKYFSQVMILLQVILACEGTSPACMREISAIAKSADLLDGIDLHSWIHHIVGVGFLGRSEVRISTTTIRYSSTVLVPWPRICLVLAASFIMIFF